MQRAGSEEALQDRRWRTGSQTSIRSRVRPYEVRSSSTFSSLLKLTSHFRAGLPPPVDEDQEEYEPAKPNFPEDAAFPFSESSSAPAPNHFPRRPTFGHRRISSNAPYGNNRASLSTLSLASDGSDSDVDDSNAAPRNAFYGVGRNDTMESVVEADYHRAAQTVLPPNRVSSVPPPSQHAPRPGHDRTRSISYGNGAPPPQTDSLHPPNTFSLLWAFAHLEGSFEVDESLIKPAEFLEVKRLIAGGLAGVGVGGGTLEERRETGGWKGWLWGSRPTQGQDGRGAASLEERKDKAIKDKSVPTFSCPPSILGVDLVLEPGQSKSCMSSSPPSITISPSLTVLTLQSLSPSESPPTSLPRSEARPSASTTTSSSGRTESRSVRIPLSSPLTVEILRSAG
jgi:hypothetical protein